MPSRRRRSCSHIAVRFPGRYRREGPAAAALPLVHHRPLLPPVHRRRARGIHPGAAAPSCSSLKLRGELERLPERATLEELRNLNKLHLFSTGLRSEQLVVLQRLRYLEYLKLAEERNGYWDCTMDCTFLVQADGFPSLQEMCFQASMYPPLCIQQGAMCCLTSLQLLCPESPVLRGASTESALGVEGIDHLVKLSEVILHHSATVSKIEAWKEAAKVHINMPYVKKLPEPAA